MNYSPYLRSVCTLILSSSVLSSLGVRCSVSTEEKQCWLGSIELYLIKVYSIASEGKLK